MDLIVGVFLERMELKLVLEVAQQGFTALWLWLHQYGTAWTATINHKKEAGNKISDLLWFSLSIFF